MKQMILFLTIFGLLSLVLFKVYARENTNNKTVDQLIQEILTSQSKTNIKDINCAKVTDSQFEKLGDAVMGIMAGSDQAHNSMDQMMGGEGSQSLKVIHIRMGRAYLGCSIGGMMGMMGNYLKGGEFPMMYGVNNSFFQVAYILWIVTWVLVIAALFAFIRWMWRKGDKVK